jgi:sec-independent protein translocase protein TatA
MIGNIGPLEILLVLAIALVVLGPKRLPEAARSVGRGLREFKESLSGVGGDGDEPETPRLEADPDPQPTKTGGRVH